MSIIKKIFFNKSRVNTMLLSILLWMVIVSFAMILELNERIKKEQYIRICPEPYVCIIPPKQWKNKVPMGLTYYKRIPV